MELLTRGKKIYIFFALKEANNCSAVNKEKAAIAARGYRLKYTEKRPNLNLKSACMV
jgi:hypothetical protein